MRTFDDKSVLVLGGSRGIGAAIVRRFAAEGAKVTFTYAASRDKAEALAVETGATPLFTALQPTDCHARQGDMWYDGNLRDGASGPAQPRTQEGRAQDPSRVAPAWGEPGGTARGVGVRG